jgi:hypothetical protein
MSAASRDRAPLDFSEVVLQGTTDPVRTYLRELAAAAGKCLTFWFHEEAEIEAGEGAVARAAEKLGLHPHEIFLVASDDFAAIVRERAATAAERGIYEVVSITPIAAASVAVAYQAYAADLDREIQALLHDLPPGLRLEDEQHDVRVDPAAKGIEVYTPAHDYEASGSARIVGRVDLVIAKSRQLRDQELIRVPKIVLELRQG